MPRITRTITPTEPPETPMFPVTVYLSPAEHAAIQALPRLYCLPSLSDAVRAAILNAASAPSGSTARDGEDFRPALATFGGPTNGL